jgi:hypothetical protein
MLTFEHEAHAYRWNGHPVPGVTSIIGSAIGDRFAHIMPEVLERKRKIGTAVHAACDLDDRGCLDEATVHPVCLPYLEAWRAFRRESRCVVTLSEEKFYHPTFGYAGALDRYVDINGGKAIVDIKTGLPGPLAALQTAAYAELVIMNVTVDLADIRIRRFAMRVMPSGKYKVDEYTSPGDWRDFLACLAVHRLKERIAA